MKGVRMKISLIVGMVFLCFFVSSKSMEALRGTWQEKALMGEYIAEFMYNLDKERCRQINILQLLSNPFHILKTCPLWFKSLTFSQKELFLKIVIQYIKNVCPTLKQRTSAVMDLTKSLENKDLIRFETTYKTVEAAIKEIHQDVPQEDDGWCLLPSSAEYMLESMNSEKITTSDYTYSWLNSCSNCFNLKDVSSRTLTWIQDLWSGNGSFEIQEAWRKAFGNLYASLKTEHYNFLVQFLEILKELHTMLENPSRATTMKNFIFTLSPVDAKRFGILCYCSLERLCFDVYFRGNKTNYTSPRDFQRSFHQDFNTYKLYWPSEVPYARIKDIECLGFLAHVALDNASYPDIVHKHTAAHIEYSIK